MAPSPQETNNPMGTPPPRDGLTGEEVVISGISGLFPNSKNVKEFMDNLYNKVNMVTKDDTKFDHADLPQFSGKISDLEKFDAQFFRVTHKQADSMEPMCRKLMEQAYGAMYDAGVNPLLYKGKKVGVFMSVFNMETGKNITSNIKMNTFIISGASKNMLANRISYWLDATGPSFSVDHPSGALICLENALNCIKSGICEAAIVGGSELVIDAVISVNMRNAGILCLDGAAKCFDKRGDGCPKSQSVCVLFLQKSKDAKRIYAEVREAGLEYGLKDGEHLRQHREPEKMVDFLKEVYSKAGVPPSEVEYVEASGAAIPETDANELQAIAEVFGKKEKPVMVGCVKSNMGDTLPVAGLCSVIKICLAYLKGELAGNLHYEDPLDIPAIQDNKVAVLTDNTSFNRGYTAVNNFSYTGNNAHLLLKGHYKPRDINRHKSDLPRLVLVSGRHEKGVKKVFDVLESQPIDQEFTGMLQEIYQVETPGFTCRGYSILDTKDEQTVSTSQSIEYYHGAPPPLWVLYSGMGSQWAGMGKEFMRIPIFAAAIEKCRKILEPKGVDVVQIITSPDKTLFDNVLNCFIGIAAVQIGLTNILKEIGLVADNLIGHSVGEIGCAYYDGCFTDEEMILTAYYRGLVSIQTKLIKGSMAAVGLGYKDMLPLLRPEVDIACRNSTEVCTISGPADIMKIFVEELKAKGIFAKEIPCGNIAYHSRYIKDVGPGFLKYLKEIIKTPVKRSKNWVSTSWPEDKRDDKMAELCSAEYYTNNLLSPVYFEEAARQIPQNAVVVEVAPHGLMQAILKRSHPNCTHIPLTRRGNSNPINFLFEAFGKLYQEGYNLKVNVLYPAIEYPVSTETSMLSHLVEFYHEEDWPVTRYQKKQNDTRIIASRKLAISIQDDDYKLIAGHCREGNIVLPEAAILFYTWNTVAMYKRLNYKEMSVKFRDVQFHADIVIDLEENLYLKFTINKGNNYFEVTRDDVLVANGYIETSNIKKLSEYRTITDNVDDITFKDNELDIVLTAEDIYEIFKLKGNSYQNEFKSIVSSSAQWDHAKVKMTGEWIPFLDSLIQLNILARNYDGISVPKLIKHLTIDMSEHQIKMVEVKDGVFDAYYDGVTTTCCGTKLEYLILTDKPVVESVPDVFKCSSLLPNAKIEATEEYKLTIEKPGDIDSLKWVNVINETKNDNLVKVYYAAPSMRDVQNAVGLVETNRGFGMDFSGVDSKGNRVMGLVSEGALASTVQPDRDLLWPVPKHWTLEEAATVPLPFVHACYCLFIRGDLNPGNTVYVNGGAGALGQAIISICLSLGCIVYTSVRDIQKKRFLMRLFPNLNESHIGFSHDVDFYNMVIHNSRNFRCKFVINCTTGATRELAMKCCGFEGYFLDVSDFDMRQNNQFGMNFMDDCKTYMTVNFSSIFRPENITERKMLHKMISEGIASGIVKPMSHVVYAAEDVERAVRLLSFSKHRGRSLIKMRASDTSDITSNVTHRMTFSSEGIYLVVCDDTVLGIQLVTHLVKRGARVLRLHLRSDYPKGFIQVHLAKWKKMGGTVTISSEKLENKTNCEKILSSSGKLLGIFLIKPKIKDNSGSDSSIQNSNKFASVVTNLDDVSRKHHPELKHFVILSRISKNDTEQFLTSMLEKICESRAKFGKPTLWLQAELLDNDELEDKSTKIRPITVEIAFKALEVSLKQNYTKVFAYNETKNISNILETIAKLLDIKNLDEVDERLCVKNLVFNEMNIEELKILIRDNFKIKFSTESIRNMTIYSLKNLCNEITKRTTKFDCKMEAFYNYVDKDEIDATQIFVPMMTFSSLAEGELNWHAKATNMLMIPGFEGHSHIFEKICESLKIRATTVQVGPSLKNESIQQIAIDLKERIKTRFILEPKFYLLGYSFGLNVALEVAALLEKDGHVGIVFCLDSSPDALRVQLEAYLGNLSEMALQNEIIQHLFYVMSGCKSDSLEKYIENTTDWNEKVTECVERLKDFTKYSNEYKRDVIEAFYHRIHLAKSYVPHLKLESNIVLLKGIPHPEIKSLPADYGLSKYAKNPVEVLNINSDVASAPYDSRVANVLNNFLDPALLEDFKIKNLCEVFSISQFRHY